MPEADRTLHMVTEALSVLVVAPFLIYASTKTDDPLVKTGLWIVAIACLIVDGYLYVKWTRD